MNDQFEAEHLYARQNIVDSVYRYCRAMDRIDRQLGLSLWTVDATLDYGPIFQGSAQEFIERACSEHEQMEATSHQVTNILVDIHADMNTADSESYITATLRDDRDGVRRDRTIRGRYLDKWTKVDARWLISERIFEHDLTSIAPVV